MHAIISKVPHAATQRHRRLQYSDVGQLLELSGIQIGTQARQAKCYAECSRILRYLGAKADILAEPRMTRQPGDAKVISQESALDMCADVRGCSESQRYIE